MTNYQQYIANTSDNICKLLGLSSDYYAEFRFECGIKYIEERYYLARFKQYLIANNMYWVWFYNQFAIVDNNLMSKKQYMLLSNDKRLYYFYLVHNNSELELSIPRFILGNQILKLKINKNGNNKN